MSWAEDVIRDHLKFLAEFEREFGPATGLLKHGRAFQSGSVKPDWLTRAAPKACYKNATHLALNRDDVFYAEGYAIVTEDLPIPIEHAWLVDTEGMVIDPTWQDASGHSISASYSIKSSLPR